MAGNCKRLIHEIFPEFDAAKYLMDGRSYQSFDYAPYPLEAFNLTNPDGHDISNCHVWLYARSLGNLKARLSFTITGPSPNCTFLMLRTPASGKQSYFLNGANCRVLSMSAQKMSYSARMVGCSSLIIGEQTFIGSARFAMLDSDIGVGAHGLWSDEVLVQGSDQHGIIDLRTGEILNGGRKFIDIGRHVWLGRRAVVSKNVTIGDGAIVGAASLVTKDVPRAVAVGGVPAKVLRTGVTWVNDPGGMSDLEEPDIARLRGRLAEQG